MPTDKQSPDGQSGADRPRLAPADPAAIARAVAILRDGGIVALPTETVYGLAARADSDAAVAAIYRAKTRPDFNPLIVHVADRAAAASLAHWDARADLLAANFWPGPLTLVLPRRADAGLADAVTAGLPTVALRCPAHVVMRAVLAQSGLPLAAPSANRSGGVSATTAAHVASSLGTAPDLILDGGACAGGIESTIVALRPAGWEILRPGPIARARLCDVLGTAPAAPTGGTIEAPGQLARHYAPGKPLRLDAILPAPDEFHIGFGTVPGVLNLSPAADLEQAAAALYAALHAAAAAPQPRIAVAPIPTDDAGTGIGAAIADRLRRAAAPSD